MAAEQHSAHLDDISDEKLYGGLMVVPEDPAFRPGEDNRGDYDELFPEAPPSPLVQRSAKATKDGLVGSWCKPSGPEAVAAFERALPTLRGVRDGVVKGRLQGLVEQGRLTPNEAAQQWAAYCQKHKTK